MKISKKKKGSLKRIASTMDEWRQRPTVSILCILSLIKFPQDHHGSRMVIDLLKFAQLIGNKAKIPTHVGPTLKSSSFCHKNLPLLAHLHLRIHLLPHNLLFLTFETDKKYTPPKNPTKQGLNFNGYEIKTEGFAEKLYRLESSL